MSTSEATRAPKEWRGRVFEDIGVGDVYRSRLGRTITETDTTWFTNLTLNTNQVHVNAPDAERTRFGRTLVDSTSTRTFMVPRRGAPEAASAFPATAAAWGVG